MTQPFAKLAAMVLGDSNASATAALRAPAIAAAIVLIIGAVGFRLKQPWLFAGLAPTIYMVAIHPGQEATRFRAVVAGHLAALACAYVAIYFVNIDVVTSLLGALKVAPLRVWASALALGVLAIAQPRLRAYHPPAAATALLVTLGAYRMTGKVPLALMGGVVVVAVLAQLVQQVRPGKGH